MITENNNNSININKDRCKRCGVKLRDVQVNRMIGNNAYNEWAREGFCSLGCFEMFPENMQTFESKFINNNKLEEAYSHTSCEVNKCTPKENSIDIINDTNENEVSNERFIIIAIRNFTLSFIGLSAVHYFTVGNIKLFQTLVGSIVATIFIFHANRRKE